jgi:hypothetical protein
LRYFDFRFALLEPPGRSADELGLLTGTVDGHLFGAALQLAQEQRMRTRVGLHSEAELDVAARPLVEPMPVDGHYPAFARWCQARTGAGPADPVQWTRCCLLDGLAARLGPLPE